MLRRSFLFVTALALGAAAQTQESAPVVAAASNLKSAIEVIAADFERDTGRKLRLSFGASGNFARQIRQGAPFELFLSADEHFVQELTREGLTRDPGRLYAIGRLALYTPRGSAIPLDPKLDGVRERLGTLRKFAIANPEHAPYGRAAREALQRLGLWEPLQSRLVIGENISQTAQFVATGSADAGIVALSLAVTPELAAKGQYVPLPESLHAPLRQRMVLTRRAGPTAAAFFDYLQTPKARAVLERYGFDSPES